MLNDSWRNKLRNLLKQNKRIAILGIGSALYGDDAAGLLLVRCLRWQDTLPDDWLVLEAGLSPENVLGALRPFIPDAVLLIDSAQMGTIPGTIRWVALDLLEGLSASSHTLPLSALASYVSKTYNCPIALLGIQPCTTDLHTVISTPVKQALRDVLYIIIQASHVAPSKKTL